MSIQALREQRAAKAKAVGELVAKKTWDRTVDTPVYDAAMLEIDDIDAQIKRIEAVNALAFETLTVDNVADRADALGQDKKSPQAKLFARWLRAGDAAVTAEEWAAIRATMSTTTGSEGGFTVQTEVAKTVLDALKAYGGMRSIASVLQTSQGNQINYPTSDGRSETGEIIGQNATATGQDVAFGTVPLVVYKYSSKVIAVPFELLQDSQVDVEAFVKARMITRLGRITNTHFTVGTGAAMPFGVMAAAPVGVTAVNGTGQVPTVTYASLVDLVHSVDPAYRGLGNCRFMMHDLSLRQVRKIVDGQGRPIFVPGYEVSSPLGAPDRLLGYPIQINQDVAVMAASARSIAFGDFSFYSIRDVMDVQMFRFTDSAYTKLGQVGFLAWMRAGGNLIDVGGAVQVFVNAAT